MFKSIRKFFSNLFNSDPAPAPQPVIVVTPEAPITAGLDADGCFQPSQFIGTPIAKYRCMIQNALTAASGAQLDNLNKNFNRNFQDRIVAADDNILSVDNVTRGRNYQVSPDPKSQNYPEYNDVIVFPKENRDAAGNVTWPGFHVSDCHNFVLSCQASGRWPNLDQPHQGVVSG